MAAQRSPRRRTREPRRRPRRPRSCRRCDRRGERRHPRPATSPGSLERIRDPERRTGAPGLIELRVRHAQTTAAAAHLELELPSRNAPIRRPGSRPRGLPCRRGPKSVVVNGCSPSGPPMRNSAQPSCSNITRRSNGERALQHAPQSLPRVGSPERSSDTRHTARPASHPGSRRSPSRDADPSPIARDRRSPASRDRDRLVRSCGPRCQISFQGVCRPAARGSHGRRVDRGAGPGTSNMLIDFARVHPWPSNHVRGSLTAGGS